MQLRVDEVYEERFAMGEHGEILSEANRPECIRAAALFPQYLCRSGRHATRSISHMRREAATPASAARNRPSAASLSVIPSPGSIPEEPSGDAEQFQGGDFVPSRRPSC